MLFCSYVRWQVFVFIDIRNKLNELEKQREKGTGNKFHGTGIYSAKELQGTECYTQDK